MRKIIANPPASLSQCVSDLAVVALSFALLLFVIAALGRLGLGVGLNIVPLGEDLNWIDMLQRGRGAETARLFWAMDHRNPLSPWWYIAARDLILSYEWGLLALRYLMALLLACSSYVMIVAICGQRSRVFAVSVALGVVMWMANRYTDQIYWNFQGALAATLISIAAYSLSQSQTSHARQFYVLSVLMYFIAFATYTVQCGALFAIGYLALRKELGELQSWSFPGIAGAVARAAIETAPYLILFAGFLLIWTTVINPAAVSAFRIEFDPLRLLASIREGLWTGDLDVFAGWVLKSPHAPTFIGVGTIIGIAFLFYLRSRMPREESAPVLSFRSCIDLAIVVLCVAAPTIFLETVSDQWRPGSRWPMIYQFTTPMIFFLIAAIGSIVMPVRRLWPLFVGFITAVGLTFTLGHNRVQNDFSRGDVLAREGLRRVVAEDFLAGYRAPIQFILMLDHAWWWRSLDTLSPVTARVWLGRSDISFRLMPTEPSPSPHYEAWWQPRFGNDSEGLKNAKVWGGAVPYEAVRVLRLLKGGAVDRLGSIGKEDIEDLMGWYASWEREQPLKLRNVTPKDICPLHWKADQDLLGNGWDVTEKNIDGQPFRWTVQKQAQLTLPNVCGRPTSIRVSLVGSVFRRNRDELRLTLDDIQLSYTRREEPGRYILEAALPASLSLTKPTMTLSLIVPQLDRVAGASRRLGVAVNSIEVFNSPKGSSMIR